MRTSRSLQAIPRRRFLGGLALALAASRSSAEIAPPHAADPIIDSHVHVWNLDQFRLSWLDHNAPLKRNFSPSDYLKAAAGLNIVAATYVEVNVAPAQRAAEARAAIDLCAQPDNPFAAAVIAADVSSPRLGEYLAAFKDSPAIKGVRMFYPGGGSTDAGFLRGLRELGRRRLSFDLQLDPDLLTDAAQSAAACPDTQFILNHCGGVEPKIFRKEFADDPQASQQRQTWRAGIRALARLPNTSCKISGVAELALPRAAAADDIAPVVHFCLDAFGPDRVLFGGNWPVCLKGTTLKHWVDSLRQIVSNRSVEDRAKLFTANARRIYRMGKASKSNHR